MIDIILDPIFSPFLYINPLLAIVIIALIVSLLITIVTKYATDQTAMKKLKAEMKELQNLMKTQKSEPDKMMKTQKKVMEKNMQYMKKSMKSTLITFIPIIIIFSWLNANMAFLPIAPDQEFDVTMTFAKGTTGDVTLIPPDTIRLISGPTADIVDNKAEWTLSGDETDAYLQFDYNGRPIQKAIIITEGKDYAPVVEKFKDPNVKTVSIGNEKLKPLNLFGWEVGWLGTYIICSILFSLLLRKLLKLH